MTGVIQVIPCTISIHAPREGGDAPQLRRFVLREISIHAPREGGDDYEKLDVSGDGHFNPRPREGGDPPRSGRPCCR